MWACHKQALPRGMPNPNKSGCAKQTTRWGCPTTLKEVGVCLVIPRKGDALKELKEECWSKNYQERECVTTSTNELNRQ